MRAAQVHFIKGVLFSSVVDKWIRRGELCQEQWINELFFRHILNHDHCFRSQKNVQHMDVESNACVSLVSIMWLIYTFF